VVREHELSTAAVFRELLQHLDTGLRVLLHQLKLSLRQAALLVKHGVGHRDLAQVMDSGREPDKCDLTVGKSEPFRGAHRVIGDALRMLERVWIAPVDDVRHRLHRSHGLLA
jgi:hypothetical protein